MPHGGPLFRVKVCGVTTPADATLVAESGADAIGLNFVPGSPRCLTPAVARQVAAAIPGSVIKVGVFAGMPADRILRVAEEVGLDAIQLHGHIGGAAGLVDPPEICAALHGLPVIRAVRLDARHGADCLAEGRAWLAAARTFGSAAAMALVDAAVIRGTAVGQLGGTGSRVDWTALAAARPLDEPVVLAGGLDPGIVAEAVRITGVPAVDAASGVETAPGRKDPAKVRAFVAAARAALGATAVRNEPTG